VNRPSMKELARQLGLDRSTISRALSEDKSHLVARETREEIRSVAIAAGYRPDLTAAALRRGRSQTVGVLVSDLGNETFINVIRTIIMSLNEGEGVPPTTPLIAETLDRPEATRQLVDTFLSRRVDAIISLASTEADQQILDDASHEVPIVLAVRSLAALSLPSALCDDKAGGALVACHFAERGHKVVCQVQGPPLAATFTNRAQGFSEVCQKHRMMEVPAGLSVQHATYATGKAAFDSILSASPRPTAIFAHNDAIALGLIEAARQRGLAVPGDTAIAGFNDTQIGRVLATPLTTVAYPIEEVGRHAGLLVRVLTVDPKAQIESKSFGPKLVVRQSA
jgi:LacI family transcriptional regulator, galactose operon repressor